MITDTPKRDYATTLGERLRRIRAQQGLSLNDVEASSAGAIKASVLGAYERGERTVSVARLRRLAEFYRVPLSELMPGAARTAQPHAPLGGVRIDIDALDTSPLPEAATVHRFVSGISTRRGDYNGRVITVRKEDLRALAAVLDLHPATLRDKLREAGIVEAVAPAEALPR